MDKEQTLQEQFRKLAGQLKDQTFPPEAWAQICDRFFDDGSGRPRTPFYPGTVEPVRQGWYERAVFARLERHYWDGAQWLGPDSKPWVDRTPRILPCWRGLPYAPI